MAGPYHHAPRLRCARCGDVIGIYEPLVAIDAYGARQTSYAADPELVRAGAELVHCACHASGQPEQSPLAGGE